MTLILPHGVIRPLTPTTAGEGSANADICICCMDRSGRWQVTLTSSEDPWCSYCFLYSTAWGQSNRQAIDQLAIDVENQMHRGLRDLGGKLLPEESDRILMSIVMTSAYINGKTHGQSNRA